MENKFFTWILIIGVIASLTVSIMAYNKQTSSSREDIRGLSLSPPASPYKANGTGSCIGKCGLSNGNCWCDSYCWMSGGDCCPNFLQANCLTEAQKPTWNSYFPSLAIQVNNGSSGGGGSSSNGSSSSLVTEIKEYLNKSIYNKLVRQEGKMASIKAECNNEKDILLAGSCEFVPDFKIDEAWNMGGALVPIKVESAYRANYFSCGRTNPFHESWNGTSSVNYTGNVTISAYITCLKIS